MRIRKRFPPPSSSDPLLIHNPLLVQHQQQEQVHFPLANQLDKTNSQPSDPPNQAQETMVLINNKDEFEEIKNNNETRKEGIQCGEESSTKAKMPWTTSHQVFGGWFGEDKTIPIKKRRGSLGKRASADLIRKDDVEEEKAMAKMKSKTNKKCVQENGDGEVLLHQEGGKGSSLSKEGVNIDLNTTIVSDDDDDQDEIKKNVKRGSVIMEGSRCSRVNGRGWRCGQQTLVGYSLCEHHLGKGRLRNMNNVRNRTKSKKGSVEIVGQVKNSRMQKKKKARVSIDRDGEEDFDDDYDEDDGVKKKKKKIGMVKARSISSLLGLGQLGEGECEVVVDEDK